MKENKYITVVAKVMVVCARELLTGEWKFKDDRAMVVKQWAAQQDIQFLNWPD